MGKIPTPPLLPYVLPPIPTMEELPHLIIETVEKKPRILLEVKKRESVTTFKGTINLLMK